MKCSNVLDWVCMIILVVGGLNWGLVGLFHFNLVDALFGSIPILVKVVYDIVGLTAIYVFIRCVTGCSKAKK